MRRAVPVIALLCCLGAQAQQRSELAELLDAGDEAFPRAIEPRAFSFPADHGPHPEFRNEWWYITGNLESTAGRRFGYELTVFRFALAPGRPESPSAWRSNQVYIAHLAVTDPEEDRFLTDEKFSRGAAGLAGATAAPFAVWIDDWRIADRIADPIADPIADRNEAGAGSVDGPREAWSLTAASDEFSLALTLDALKPPVLNGDAGLSQKSDDPGNASYYYSLTRIATRGEIRIGDDVFDVAGSSWLDREWSSSALDANQVGWDWFALQLDDGTELMYYSIRRSDGREDRNSAGTLTAYDGAAAKLSADAVELTVLDTWDSPAGGTYPSRWRLAVPAEGLVLEIDPVMANQELFTTVRYWEGAVDVTGTRGNERISGRGYVELTGYAPSGNDE